MKKAHIRLLTLAVTAATPFASVTTTANAEPVHATNKVDSKQEKVESKFDLIGTPQWNHDIQKLKSEGKLKQTKQVKNGNFEVTSYHVIDPKTGDKVGEFSVKKPLTAERIGGKFDGMKPAIVFNQTDQKALKSGGGAAVAGMAAAWAAILSETVVGSVLSAGAISFIGGVAAVYLAQNGVCSDNKDLVVNVAKQAHCE
ncbi:hypothetical protein ACGE24_03990 [Corynebacterium kroppenstedtii]|uniref:hypothetical protein n=1 Tax=Corynebacterium sp. PCR 32 TaxID=3351342 RepID=UPI003095CF1F